MISQNDLRILVVGERAENRQVARWMLNRAFAQLTVLEAVDDATLHSVFEDERVDCILVDEELSDFEDLLNSLSLKNRAHVPVILVSAEHSEIRSKAESLGVEHWLSKDNLSAQTMELIVKKAIDVSSLRLMLEEQGRELDRLRAEVEQRAVIDAQMEQAAARLEQTDRLNELDPGDDTIVDEPFDIAGLSIPASRTGGDYYDYLPIADDLLTITIGECSGQGMAPAMMMASLRAYLRVISTSTMDVEETISQANRLITEDIQDEEFIVTMMVAQIDQLTRSIRYASAGHQAHILDRHGEVHVLHSTGMPMGIQADTIIPEGTPHKLKSGDLLLLSTDGAQKMVSPSGEQFGIERVLDIIRTNRNLPARMIVNFLRKECRAFADPNAQEDDMTFVIVKSEGISYL